MSQRLMPKPIRAYVRWVDKLNAAVGFVVMYMVFAMMGVLLFGSISRYVFNVPYLWIVEMAQFLMAAYYLLGGGYSMQLDAHVRMDVLYDRWSPRGRAFADSITAFCLLFYLVFLLLGGGYSMQLDAHVRMDVLYERWSPRTRSFLDSITAFCLVFYLVFLIYGGYSSTAYAYKYGQTNYSAWAPLMWPIKAVMTVGIFLMLLQAFSFFFKDLARVMGRELA
jgi:TRAP-type mannitol/chloroaromatic compound transport system permease small subunit